MVYNNYWRFWYTFYYGMTQEISDRMARIEFVLHGMKSNDPEHSKLETYREDLRKLSNESFQAMHRTRDNAYDEIGYMEV